jgi:hypothetical protein
MGISPEIVEQCTGVKEVNGLPFLLGFVTFVITGIKDLLGGRALFLEDLGTPGDLA